MVSVDFATPRLPLFGLMDFTGVLLRVEETTCRSFSPPLNRASATKALMWHST